MRDSGARVNLEESCGPVKWTRTWRLDAKWRRGGEEAAEAEWDRGFTGQGQECPAPRLRVRRCQDFTSLGMPGVARI